MNNIASLKVDNDDFQVEFEVMSPIDAELMNDPERREIAMALRDLNAQIDLKEEELAKLNSEIDRLTNHADGLDYAVAVASGILTGLIDSFFVGEMEIDKEKIQKQLEKKYHTANDNKYNHKISDKDGNKQSVSSALYHRLDDLAHHPTPLGLVASILVRYFRLVVFIDGSDGKPHIFFAEDSDNPKTKKLEKEQLIKAWVGAVVAGLFLWLANVAEKKYEEKYDSEMPEPLKKIVEAIAKAPLFIEILKCADSWVGHMMSDVSTSQGIPGVFLSLLKEISVLPGLRNTNLPVFVDNLYNKGKGTLPDWGGIAFVAAKKQAMPVLINEVLVRGFYFVRRFIMEYKKQNSFKDINWQNVIPFGNRTVERMMTIASGTFTVVDIADAAIRSGGFNAACLLRVNFVGIGRFAVAVVVDIGMGIKRNKLRNERMALYSEMLNLVNAKVFYLEAGMWKSAIDTQKVLDETMRIAEESAFEFKENWILIEKDMENIHKNIGKITSDSNLTEELLDTLTIG